MSKDLKRLIEVARGLYPPALVLKNGKVVNTFSCEVEPLDVAIHDGMVVGVGHYDGPNVVDVAGDYLIPGFIDAHVHVESSMLSPAEFARAVIPMGTTAVVADPHEIANVLGSKGIDYMLNARTGLPVDIFLLIPSCVPATDMETSGARLDAHDIAVFRGKPGVLGLAEVMNVPGVIHGGDESLAKIAVYKNDVIDGHAPLLIGRDLNAYILAGPGSDHECSSIDEAREKLRRGMYVMIREGSLARNLKALLPLVSPFSAGRCMLVTDDVHPHDLMDKGHINHVVNMAIAEGLDPLLAIQMVTLNPARYFGLNRSGAIAPGYDADILRASSLKPIAIRSVFKRGQRIYDDGRMEHAFPPLPPSDDLGSMHIAPYDIDLFRIRAKSDRSMRVIGLVKNQLITDVVETRPRIENGLAVSDPEHDIVKIAVAERHKGTGNIGLGFIRGFGLKMGAIASSVAHDSHNIIAIGTNDRDMFHAVRQIEGMGGGVVVVSGERVVASLPLPIAGLMSERPLQEVAGAWKQVEQAARSLGSGLDHPFMALSFMALPVIPRLKITDKGLVDVEQFQPVDLFV